jgi:hypothetical protein
MKAKNCRVCGRFADSPYSICDRCYQKLKLGLPIHLREKRSFCDDCPEKAYRPSFDANFPCPYVNME